MLFVWLVPLGRDDPSRHGVNGVDSYCCGLALFDQTSAGCWSQSSRGWSRFTGLPASIQAGSAVNRAQVEPTKNARKSRIL